MKIALIGYGKMGHEIEKSAISRGHTINLILNDESDWVSNEGLLKTCDVAVEFSVPSNAIKNINRCIEAGIPVVIGTTGWYDHFDQVTELCKKLGGSMFYASNFSIGVNVFFEINRRLASMLETNPDYLPSMTEIHHIQKLDSPSGTAITLAKDIIAANKNFQKFTDGAADQGAIPIQSIREGDVTGTHTITWASEVDCISITHEAKNRQGFAFGAVMAAEWISSRKGVFTMKDLLNF